GTEDVAGRDGPGVGRPLVSGLQSFSAAYALKRPRVGKALSLLGPGKSHQANPSRLNLEKLHGRFRAGTAPFEYNRYVAPGGPSGPGRRPLSRPPGSVGPLLLPAPGLALKRLSSLTGNPPSGARRPRPRKPSGRFGPRTSRRRGGPGTVLTENP